MKTKILAFHGVDYHVPEPFEFLEKELADYPSFCGPGSGIGDRLVPEYIGAMKCSHLCHIHDEWWEHCDATWIAFIRANMAFAYNLAVYLATGGGGFIKRAWRLIKGAVYIGAVSTVGWKIFKKLKGM